MVLRVLIESDLSPQIKLNPEQLGVLNQSVEYFEL